MPEERLQILADEVTALRLRMSKLYTPDEDNTALETFLEACEAFNSAIEDYQNER